MSSGRIRSRDTREQSKNLTSENIRLKKAIKLPFTAINV